jgi:3',5'-cyclic AMP phosphodiesterase CpdA
MRGYIASIQQFCLLAILCVCMIALGQPAQAQVTIAQISDTHLGESHSPHAADNLRRTVDMVNRRHPDAVVLSGDIGENPEEWQQARQILKGLKAPLYYAPGNHDVHSNDVAQYRNFFGPDYYSFKVKDITFVVIDSQLLGNYDEFGLPALQPMPPQTEAEGAKMLAALAHPDDRLGRDYKRRNVAQTADDRVGEAKDQNQGRDNDHDHGRIVIGIQHIPVFRDERVLPDPKPYWIITEPYRSHELALLHQLGIKHMLVGHWHVGDVFERDGITWHVAPSTSRMLPWSGQLGFAMHTISPDGDVKTEFVSLGTGQ